MALIANDFQESSTILKAGVRVMNSEVSKEDSDIDDEAGL